MAFEHHFSAPEPHKLGNGVATFARHVWLFVVLVLVVPVIAAWLARGGFAIAGCVPQAKACLTDPANALGVNAFKTTLDIAWIVGASDLTTLALITLAALAAIIGLRPVWAALTVLIVPHFSLLLPVLLVGQTSYNGCAISEAHIGSCVLWGFKMGDTFHNAAIAPALIYTYTPFAVAGALVAGLLGWIVYWGACKVSRPSAHHVFRHTSATRSRE